MQYQYDDGSSIGVDQSGEVWSREIGATTWENDAQPAPAGWSVFNTDAIEQSRMGQGYPQNGQSWDTNAAFLGISRLIDTAGRAYANIKGSQPATTAGQDGQTYVQGTRSPAAGGGAIMGGNMLPLIMLAALAFLALR